MLAKKKTTSFCHLETGGGGRVNVELTSKPQKWSIFLLSQERTKYLTFIDFEQKKVRGVEAKYKIIFKRENMSDFLFPKKTLK